MSEIITVRGFVATDVALNTRAGGLAVAGFRLGAPERRFDRVNGTWVDGETNWFSVSCFRELAVNVKGSLEKGQRVLVTGRLRVRPFNREDGSTGTAVDIDAETVGHDLLFGTATFAKRIRQEGQPVEAQASRGDVGRSMAGEHDETLESDESDPAQEGEAEAFAAGPSVFEQEGSAA